MCVCACEQTRVHTGVCTHTQTHTYRHAYTIFSLFLVPEVANVKSYTVLERNGFVYMWYHAEGVEPYWEPPELEEITSGEWKYRGRTEHEINCHIEVQVVLLSFLQPINRLLPCHIVNNISEMTMCVCVCVCVLCYI